MVKPKFESIDYSFDKVKFYNILLSYNQLNLDLSEFKEFDEYDFVFQSKGPMIVKNTKTNKSHRYSQTQSPHLYVIVNNTVDKSLYKFENSTPTWTKVKVPKFNKFYGDISFELFYNSFKDLENSFANEKDLSFEVFGENFNKLLEFLDNSSEINDELFVIRFRNLIKSINIDSNHYPETFQVFDKYINLSNEIKEINTNDSLTNLINDKISKVNEVVLPSTNDQNEENFHFRLQTKFTPKIIVTDSGIKPNFTQIYFSNFNVNFDILEISIFLEGSFQLVSMA